MNKPILYLRTSTKDQNPELQRGQGVTFCKEMGLGEPEVYSEQGSAYKLEKIRPVWEQVISKAKKEKRDIVVWRYDRSFRNRKEFYKFIKVMFEVYGTKVYSVTEPSILSFWNLIDQSHSEDPIFNELLNGLFKVLWDFMIQQAGEQAEEESRKKSQRVKLAVRKESGVTKSYKGNKWGRKALKIDDKIINAHKEGKNMRQITKDVFYWDKNKHKKFVSLGYVHKTLTEFKERNRVAKAKEINCLINEQQ